MLHLGVELILVEERFKEDKNAGFNMDLVTKGMTGVTRQSDRDFRRDRAKNNGRGRPGGTVTIISYTPLGRDQLCPGGNPAGIPASRREYRRN